MLVHDHSLNWEKDYGDKWLSSNRADLRNELLRLATAPSAELGLDGNPAKIVFGAEVVEVDTEKGRVTLKNGDVYESDLVIGMKLPCLPVSIQLTTNARLKVPTALIRLSDHSLLTSPSP